MEEMAKALGSSGHQLESVLEQLKELDALMGRTQNIEEYNSLVEKFNELHKLALDPQGDAGNSPGGLRGLQTYIHRYILPDPQQEEEKDLKNGHAETI